MFDSTFFKFLAAFIGILAVSFLITGITGGLGDTTSSGQSAPKATVR